MNTFDPTAPLAGPPEPWAATDTPSERTGPPFHMTDMIAAEPHLARRLLGSFSEPGSAADRLAAAIRDAVGTRDGVTFTGCGTSEHGALGMAEIIRDALASAELPGRGVMATEAYELSLAPPTGGLVVGVSHEGGTAATNAALRAAREAGARVAIVTVSERSPGASLVDPSLVVATRELDTSWCHTVGYVSPLLVGTAVGARLSGRRVDPEAAASVMAAAAADTTATEAMAAALAGVDRLIVIASGADRVAGRELTLKVEEASWLPTAYRDLETFLHGHLPAVGETTGLVLVATDRRAAAERVARARVALAAARQVGARVAAIVSHEAGDGLRNEATPAGRLIVPDAPELPAPVASLLGSATALQLLTERIARARGTNPDPIRRADARYRAAAEAAEAT
jgi:fructoselysine-6-P-deglycase FrlB-like protein